MEALSFKEFYNCVLTTHTTEPCAPDNNPGFLKQRHHIYTQRQWFATGNSTHSAHLANNMSNSNSQQQILKSQEVLTIMPLILSTNNIDKLA